MTSATSFDSSGAGWDHTEDVIVIGSGAGGMVAALTAHDGGANVLLVEKDTTYGGSSSRSGGGMWIPNNHLMQADGIDDKPEEVLTYLRAVVPPEEPQDRLEAYVKYAPEMFKYLCDRAGMKAERIPDYPDYHPSKPCWRKGRIVTSKVFDARPLGQDLLSIHNNQGSIMGRYHVTTREVNAILQKQSGWQKIIIKRMIKYWLDIPWRFKSKISRDLGFGAALIGTLRLAMKNRNIPLWLNAPARELIQENGRVIGLVVTRDGRRLRIRANKGVIFASGGFDGNQTLREKYLPHPTDAAWACGTPANTGDALNMGQAVGAKIDYMGQVAWCPVDMIPGKLSGNPKVVDRAWPGSMIVNKRGERFMDEALPYREAVWAMYDNNTPQGTSIPAYMIFDGAFRKTAPIGPLLPGMPDSMAPPGYLEIGNTLEELAQKLGVDPAGLKATAAKMSDYACSGVDFDFGRGGNYYDRYYGYEKHDGPNVCLATFETPPFYGVRIWPGDFGTAGGLKCDVHARVLNEQGEAIPGLYATGNCSAGAIAATYPGPGCTLGPTMTYGYIAARHLTQKI